MTELYWTKILIPYRASKYVNSRTRITYLTHTLTVNILKRTDSIAVHFCSQLFHKICIPSTPDPLSVLLTDFDGHSAWRFIACKRTGEFTAWSDVPGPPASSTEKSLAPPWPILRSSFGTIRSIRRSTSVLPVHSSNQSKNFSNARQNLKRPIKKINLAVRIVTLRRPRL